MAEGARSRRTTGSLVLLGVTIIAAVVYELLPVGLLSSIASEFSVTEQEAGLLVSSFSVIVVIGSIPLSAMTARFDARTTLAVVLAMFGLSAAVMALSPTLEVAIIARALGGAAHAVIFTPVYRIALSLVPHRQAVAATTVSAGNALALALGVPFATALGVAWSWRAPFIVIAALFAALIIAVIVFIPAHAGAGEERFTTRTVLRAAVEPALLRVASTVVVILLAQFLTYTYVEPLLRGAGVLEEQVGPVLLGYGIASVAGLLIASRVTATRPAVALRFALGFIIVALLLVAAMRDSATGVTIAVILWGLGFGMMPVLLQVLALKASHRLPAASASVSNTAFNIGITLGAIVGGQVIALTGFGGLGLVSGGLLVVVLAAVAIPGWLPSDRDRAR